jgi:hypothetical protein
MSEFPLVANRESPSLPEVGDDIDGHTRILRAVRECVMIGERRTKNLLSSFVRVSEIVDLGLAEVQGGRLVVATVGEVELPDLETTSIGIASATSDITAGSLPTTDLAVVAGRVFEIQVFVTTPFNGTASLTVGDASDHDRLFTAADSVLSVAGNSISQIGAKYSADTQLNIYYTAGGATVGEAWVSVIYQGFDDITAVSGGGGGGSGGTVDAVVAGNNVSVDNSDPANPIVSVALKETRGASWSEVALGSGITTGVSSPYILIPFNATVAKVTLLASSSCDAVVDVLKSTYAAFPTMASICGGNEPELSGSQKSQDPTLLGWTTGVTAGDILQFEVVSIDAGVQFLAIQLELTY